MSNCNGRARPTETSRWFDLRRLSAVAALTAGTLTVAHAAIGAHDDLMPVPAQLTAESGQLRVDGRLTIALRGPDDPRLRDAIDRALNAWEQRTGITFAHLPAGPFAIGGADLAAKATIVVDSAAPAATVPTLGEDESYTLDVTPAQAVLRAPTDIGAMRGLETLLQLLQSDEKGWFVPAVAIQDRPRFPWRGLLIDVCRHWQPIEVIKRNLDGMALVKLNVLHLHLTEDQGFRIESKRYPRLQEYGSDGHFFTQDQIRDIIAYAAARGIRVVPEFDIPGHATSWVVGFPELASGPGPYVIERQWGVFDPVLDPTNEKTYELLDGFLGEMATLFPDPYIHIGGDENNGKQWSANPRIQQFIREHHLKNNEGIHAYFNGRIREILRKHGKKMIGWDEILHPDLPKDSVIQSWRGAKGLAEAAGQGYTAILSNGYYIDLCRSAAEHYRNDPIPANTTLTPEEQRHILGGEATMWSEWVTPETIDSRIWPRTAAIAERLWSPREVNDVSDMYRRLALVRLRLEEAGLQHDKNRPAMIRRFAGDAADRHTLESLTTLIAAIEPVKDYRRGNKQPDAIQPTPLTGLADCAQPESDTARDFANAADTYLFSKENAQGAAYTALTRQLAAWHEAAEGIVQNSADASPRVGSEAAPVAHALAEVAAIAAEAVNKLQTHATSDATWRQAEFARLDTAGILQAPVELPMIGVVRRLVAAASISHDGVAPDVWQRQVRQLGAPATTPSAP